MNEQSYSYNADQYIANKGIAGFIDVETTGLNPNYDEIIEFSICLFTFDRITGKIKGITEEYTGLCEPKIPISPGAARVHGIKPCDVKGKCLDEGRINSMIQKADFLIAHNMNFDYKFVKRVFPICDTKKWVCSMKGIDWFKRGFSSRALQKLLQAHGIRVKNAHRADSDVKAAIRLLSLLDRDGKYYLAELLEQFHYIDTPQTKVRGLFD